jgi:mRNA interferase HicA
MKCSELLRILTKNRWIVISSGESHLKMKHQIKQGLIILPDHGSREIGKGLEKKILKVAGIKK